MSTPAPERSGSPPDDYPRVHGGGALGARLRRLSDAIDRDAALAYSRFGVEFEQRWFGPLNLIARYGPLSGGQIAASLGISHVAVSQARSSLEKKGLIVAHTDAGDARRRLLSLTAEGEALIVRIAPLWDALSIAASRLNDEAGDVVTALDALESALARRSLLERVEDQT